MPTHPAATTYRQDYTPPSHWIDHVTLHFSLDPQRTIVRCRFTGRRNTQRADLSPLILNGEALELIEVRRNGIPLTPMQYQLHDGKLVISIEDSSFELDTVVALNPQSNTELMGLYISNGNFFTQCEAEGFRRITFFPDRPDIMARYRVTLVAAQAHYPILLSNGNLVAQGQLDNGLHWAEWEDPFPKPCYLFALVAGQLACQEQTFITRSGEKKLLQIWVEEADRHKTSHALASLVRAIQWDERRFGLPLDLERFMIVAVSDFNMGAMENKGLNIFNTKYVLADPNTATDMDYFNIESVVGHEYFHNWTGNRVTCRDWFQLSLKEGLTVFRDQEFSMDMASHYGENPAARAVCRIQDVRNLRNLQFPEDAGPLAHPVRPESYQEINNFYTMTVYEKGAEVVRMIQTLLGKEGFRRGLDLYFQRHDGQAVTCDDFLDAMADANEKNLDQFAHWYQQAGTPHIKAQGHYDADTQTYTLTLTQNCPATPGQFEKLPFHIPIAVGLIDSSVTPQDMPLSINHKNSAATTTCILELCSSQQQFSFNAIPRPPIPSLLRDFSAPVIIEYDYTDAELALLMTHDSDPFNRWEAGQQLAVRRILAHLQATSFTLSEQDEYLAACRAILTNRELDAGFKELMLTLPNEAYLAEQVEIIDAVSIHQAREKMRQTLAQTLQAEWLTTYQTIYSPGHYSPDPISSGQRALKNLALHYLILCQNNSFNSLAAQQYQSANNMTDRFAALSALVNSNAHERVAVLQDFAERYAQQALVMDKWFTVQATRIGVSGLPPVLQEIRQLMQHPAFSLKNPNKVRSLISVFCHSNPAQFHAPDGLGYIFWGEQIQLLDQLNPQVAARLARALDHWRKHIPHQRELMQQALEKTNHINLSSDTREVIEKALGS